MQNKTNLNLAQFRWTLATCFLLGVGILFTSMLIGKNELFLMLNHDLGPTADYFFRFVTYGGDGILWACWLIYFLVKRTTRYLPLIAGSFLLLTFFTQLSKQVILPDEPRPSLAIANQQLVHYVEGVTLHSVNSFPSGHTATAFLFVLLISILSNQKWLLFVGMLVALLVGYSRIYLGQHFPLDVGGGILVACVSALLAFAIQRTFDRKQKKRNFKVK